MGNKEALLNAAKECLYEQGFAHTTARDIASKAGVSLAGIGYHYGTTEALLSTALLEVLAEQGDTIEQALTLQTSAPQEPLDVVERYLKAIYSAMTQHPKIWEASFEAYPAARNNPQLMAHLAGGYQQARSGLASVLEQITTLSPQEARTLSALINTFIAGIAAQWLTDPQGAPTVEDLMDGLKAAFKGK